MFWGYPFFFGSLKDFVNCLIKSSGGLSLATFLGRRGLVQPGVLIDGVGSRETVLGVIVVLGASRASRVLEDGDALGEQILQLVLICAIVLLDLGSLDPELVRAWVGRAGIGEETTTLAGVSLVQGLGVEVRDGNRSSVRGASERHCVESCRLKREREKVCEGEEWNRMNE